MAQTADTNRSSVYITPETTWGVAPTGATKHDFAPTSETMNVSRNPAVSDRINSKRVITQQIPVDMTISGDLNTELSYGEYDRYIASALQGEWTTATASNVDAKAAAGNVPAQFTVSDGSVFRVGMLVKATGFTTTTNNGTYQIRAIAGNILSVDGTLTDETGGGTIAGDYLTNGVSVSSYYIEKLFRFTDGSSNQVLALRGCQINTMSLNFTVGEKVTLGFGIMGGEAQDGDGTSLIAGTISPPMDNPMFNAAEQVGRVIIGGSTMGYLKNMTVETTNNIYDNMAVGVRTTLQQGTGRFETSISSSFYFRDFTHYNNAVNSQEFDMGWSDTDELGNSYGFWFPRCKFSEVPTPQIAGHSQSVQFDASVMVLGDGDTGVAMVVSRIPA